MTQLTALVNFAFSQPEIIQPILTGISEENGRENASLRNCRLVDRLPLYPLLRS